MCTVLAYTDGSAYTGDMTGGVGVYLEVISDNDEVCVVRFKKGYTNAKIGAMEVGAVKHALEIIKEVDRENTDMVIVSDSQYVVNSIKAGWVYRWISDMSIEHRPNGSLWKEVVALIKEYRSVTMRWVRGHIGVAGNEEADALAGEARREVVRGILSKTE